MVKPILGSPKIPTREFLSKNFHWKVKTFQPSLNDAVSLPIRTNKFASPKIGMEIPYHGSSKFSRGKFFNKNFLHKMKVSHLHTIVENHSPTAFNIGKNTVLCLYFLYVLSRQKFSVLNFRPGKVHPSQSRNARLGRRQVQKQRQMRMFWHRHR